MPKCKNNCDKFDIKHIHVIYDHKVLMLHRIKYMGINGYLKEIEKINQFYNQLEHKALLARNILLKDIISQNNNLIDNVIKLISEIEIGEKETIKLFLKNIIK